MADHYVTITLLCLGYFYCYVWCVPMCWAIGLVIGAVANNVISGFVIIHLVTLAGTAVTCWLS